MVIEIISLLDKIREYCESDAKLFLRNIDDTIYDDCRDLSPENTPNNELVLATVAILKGLDEWSKANPQDLAKLSRFFKDIGELRQKAEAGKAKIVTKYQANVLTGLPAKYIRPTQKPGPDTELIIMEGDSAKGTVLKGRDPRTQGLFPIRGKIINAFKCTRQKFFENEEVQGITRIILGTDYKRGFKVEDCKVGKVIFMSDADVDN